MDRVSPLPSRGSVFFDVRDEGRSLRLSYHADTDGFVLSMWRDSYCLGTFRLPAEDAPRFIHTMVASLAEWRQDVQSGDSEIG